MSEPEPTMEHDGMSVYRDYILGVRIVEIGSADGDGAETETGTGPGPRYRFEAPHHQGIEFDDPDLAELYADVYFDVNGFEEAGTGTRGVPPEIIQAGKDTTVAYFLTQPGTDTNWVASFFGKTPNEVERYVSWVRERATEIRRGARERGME